MRKQKKSNDTNFGKPSDEVKEAGAIYRTKMRERVQLYQFNWPQKIPHDAEFERAKKVLIAEKLRRIDILMTHYRIGNRREERAYFALALRLADKFVQGFDPFSLSVRGRPRSVLSDHEGLAGAIDAAMEEKNVGVSQACNDLSQDRKRQWKGKKKEELEANYYRYVKALEDKNDRLKRECAKLKEEQKARCEDAPRHREPTLNNWLATSLNYEK